MRTLFSQALRKRTNNYKSIPAEERKIESHENDAAAEESVDGPYRFATTSDSNDDDDQDESITLLRLPPRWELQKFLIFHWESLGMRCKDGTVAKFNATRNLQIFLIFSAAIFAITIYDHFRGLIPLAYSILVYHGKIRSFYDDSYLAPWDLRNVRLQNDALKERLEINTTANKTKNRSTSEHSAASTILELPQNMSFSDFSYILPPDSSELNPNYNFGKKVPFLINPHVSLSFSPHERMTTIDNKQSSKHLRKNNHAHLRSKSPFSSRYCTFSTPPQRDKRNVIHLSSRDFINHLNPWHCVNEYPLVIWCLLEALEEYKPGNEGDNYNYPNSEDKKLLDFDLVFPEGTDESTWCVKLAKLLVGTSSQSITYSTSGNTSPPATTRQTSPKDESGNQQVDHHLTLQRSPWYRDKTLVTSNFYSFDIHQEPIQEYMLLRQRILRNLDRLYHYRDNPVGKLTEDEYYAVFVQRGRTRRAVDSRTYKLETLLTSIVNKQRRPQQAFNATTNNDENNLRDQDHDMTYNGVNRSDILIHGKNYNSNSNSPTIPKLKLLYLEDYPLHTQIHLISQTELLIGVHGAGLMNMLWLPPKSGVIEITLRKNWNEDWYHKGDYFNLARYLGGLDLEYRYYDADQIYVGGVGSGIGRGLDVDGVYLDGAEFGELVREFWEYLVLKGGINNENDGVEI